MQISNNSVHLFRYLDVAIAIAVTTLDSEIFQLALGGDAVVCRLDELVRGEDLLAHMGALEVVRQLVGNRLGYQLLTRVGLLTRMSARLQSIAEGPWGTVALPGSVS